MKFLRTGLLLLLIASCNAPKATYDYDQNYNFTELTTYQFYPDLITRLSQLDEQRLLRILESELNLKGFHSAQNPNVYVNFYAEEYETASRNNLGIGVGGGGGNVGVGVSGGIPIGGPETYLRITFDFIDASNDSLVWQAIVDSQFNKNASPRERELQLKSIVQKALKGYPPKND
ncbi:DUF4136 domain-containing protein [Gillisia sp. M10.2A]|uniref:DUF4136 domain-containing protein n=1 Tax=Gillisia lutea TaxID=2909668 RepID=A0ABS9EH95_9FLAO|nr:DUF4136 domain-containing protein [Gillisia lutea]MCF4102244.1 DUF4136 domain-containing protein [Gillisia lutea]